MAKQLIIGMDFGTTNSVVATKFSDEDTITFVTDDNSPKIPSVILETAEGHIYFGVKATKRLLKKGDVRHSYFKSKLLSSDSKEAHLAKNHIRAFIKYLYGLIEIWTADYIYDEVVLRYSRPANWQKEHIEVLHSAIIDAGFKGKIEQYEEPYAAIFYSMMRNKDRIIESNLLKRGLFTNILLFDLGAGTADLTVTRATLNENSEVVFVDPKAYPHDRSLGQLGGGDELDGLLHDYIIHTYFAGTETKFYQKNNTKSWKEDILSDCLNNNEEVPPPALIDVFANFTIDPQQFEELSSKHWHTLREIVKTSLQDYKLQTGIGEEGIDLIILSGGHSRWKMVRDIFETEAFHKIVKNSDIRIIQEEKPETTVACGLTVLKKNIRYERFVGTNYWAELYVDNECKGHDLLLAQGMTMPHKKEITMKGIGRAKVWTEAFSINLRIYKGANWNERVHYMTFDLDHSDYSLFMFAFTGLGLAPKEDFDIYVPITAIVDEKGNVSINASPSSVRCEIHPNLNNNNGDNYLEWYIDDPCPLGLY